MAVDGAYTSSLRTFAPGDAIEATLPSSDATMQSCFRRCISRRLMISTPAWHYSSESASVIALFDC